VTFFFKKTARLGVEMSEYDACQGKSG